MPGMQGWFNMLKQSNTIYQFNGIKHQEPHDHLHRCRHRIWPNLTAFHDKSIQQIRKEGNLIHSGKGYLWKPTTYILLNGERLNAT